MINSAVYNLKICLLFSLEREENVKCDILSAYTALLRATRPPPALQMTIVPSDNSPQALLLQRVSCLFCSPITCNIKSVVHTVIELL